MIQIRIERGFLHSVHRGIYLVGHLAVHPLGYPTAAVLACAPRALLSYETAGWLLGFMSDPDRPIHVTAVGRRPCKREGIDLHYLNAIGPTEVRRKHGLPLTAPSLILLDIAGARPGDQFRRALNEARVQRCVNDSQLRATLARHSNRRGAARLRRHLETEAAALVTGSEAAALFLALAVEAGLTPDDSEVAIGPYRVDFLYPAEQLVVEVDGFQFHATPARFVSDRRRVAELMARGYEVFPVTWFDLTGEPAEMLRRLRTTLARRRIERAES